VERPLPKPSDEGYIEARLLEALGEARLALEYLERGLTRNAAGKAFQAWKALLAALLWVAVVLDLHDYQHHGLDPSGELSKYATREDAAADITSVLEELTRRAEVLKGRVKRSGELEKALEELKQALTRRAQ